jgi:DNA polymerase delta subunit 4
MPPRRRAAANAQSRITFGTQSRVTKPSTTPTTLHKGKDLASKAPRTTDQSASATPEPAQVVAPELSKPHITELAVRQPEPKQIRTPEEEQALKVSLKDLRKYWNEKEPEKDRDQPFRCEFCWTCPEMPGTPLTVRRYYRASRRREPRGEDSPEFRSV